MIWGLYVDYSSSAVAYIFNNGRHIYSNMVGIFLEGYMPIMQKVCIPVLLVTLLLAVGYMKQIYLHSSLTCAPELIWICDIYMWHLRAHIVVGTYLAITREVCIGGGCVLAHLCQKFWVYMSCMMPIWIIFAIWQLYLFRVICDRGVSTWYTYMHTCIPTCIYTYTYRLMYVCLHTYLNVYIHICMHAHICTYSRT